MDDSVRKTLIAALSTYEGDNLQRAQYAFRGCTPEQMQQEYGQSGQTRQQILDGYQQHANQVAAARRWVALYQPLNGSEQR
jgi:hypothetical protein